MKHFIWSLPFLAVLASCAPGMSSSASLPLVSGQVWAVTGEAGTVRTSAQVAVKTVLNPNPGVYGSSDVLGLLSAVSGSGEPVVILNANENLLRFVWRDRDAPGGGVGYLCRVQPFDPKGTVFSGSLMVQDDVVGTCTATFR
ncbi:hypothetical protein [Deinococcus aquiradiocola]|uniref:Lipoprotein n=1 Tax=Deinococcus aquiradiocola TaxID=393059 RepID=A0A917PFB4_9DEIO|nr:hypothetical protein [Deinococcus aquiradiocola]GGJ73899.1 hypothetical protein GCM10008939_17740 [Deinococcus aquiradiocola]